MWDLDCEESWALKYWCFELWCWRRLLRVPWTARRSYQSVLKEISPGCSLEGWCWSRNSNTLATSSKSWLIGKDPDAGGEGDNRGWDGWVASPTRWTWVWVKSGSWWGIGMPGMLLFMGSPRVKHDWATELKWMVKSKRVYAQGDFQCLCPCGEPLPTQTSTGGPPTLRVVCSVSFRVTAPLLWVLVLAKFFCALQDWSLCFPQSSGRPVIKTLLALKVRFLGDSQSLRWIPRLGSMTWGLEPSPQCDNFFGVIVFQSVDHPPSGYGIWFYHDCNHLSVASSLSFDLGHLFQ